MKEENIKIIYTWLSLIDDMDYLMYIRLMKVFESVKKLYFLSYNKFKFKEILIQNSIFLSQVLFNKLTSLNLKEKSIKMYNNLVNQNVKIISVEDKEFPKNKFKYMYNPPICLFTYGNISKINNKVIYLHKEKFNEYGNKLYSTFYEYIKSNKWNIISNIHEKIQNNQISDIKVMNCDIFSEKFTIDDFVKNSCSLYIFVPEKVKCLKEKLYNIELITSICDLCVIPQAKYDTNMHVKNLVEIFLEQGKNVLVVPGNIYCKYNYLSNYLIKEGAEILLNKHDIDKYL